MIDINQASRTIALASRLRLLRATQHITQKQCAENLCVELTNYGKWENGVSPNLDTLCHIAEYYGVTTDYLLGLDDRIERDKFTRYIQDPGMPEELWFRGIGYDDHEYHEGDLIIRNWSGQYGGSVWIYSDANSSFTAVDPKTVQQFTGRYDSDGNREWE